MIKLINIASVGALIAAGLIIVPGEAAQKRTEPLKVESGKIANQLEKQVGMPESRVVRVVYPSPFETQR